MFGTIQCQLVTGIQPNLGLALAFVYFILFSL